MSLITSAAESMLRLSEVEKATVNAALPMMADDVAAINANQDIIRAAYALIVRAAPVVNYLLDNWKTLGPVLHDILDGSGGLFEIGGAVSCAKDVETILKANPRLAGEAQTLYAQLQPLINKLTTDLPKIAPALQIILGKAGAVTV